MRFIRIDFLAHLFDSVMVLRSILSLVDHMCERKYILNIHALFLKYEMKTWTSS